MLFLKMIITTWNIRQGGGKSKLGNQFELKEFHNVVLKNGAVPLDILEDIVDDYIKSELK